MWTVTLFTALTVLQGVAKSRIYQMTRNESLSFPGMRLVDHVIEELTTKRQVIHCAYECIKLSRCLSFNYELDSFVCQLNDGDHEKFSESFIEEEYGTRIEYHQRNAFSIDQEALGPCATDPCDNGGQCLDTVNSELERTYFCVCSDDWMGDNCDVQMNRIDWGEWDDWGTCSVTCETGWTTRRRPCIDTVTGEVLPSTKCFGRDVEYMSCTLQACPRWNEWEDWGECSTRDTCGKGVKHRHRTCANGGTPGIDRYCLGFTNQTAPCYGINCYGMLAVKDIETHGQGRLEIIDNVEGWTEMAICADDNWDIVIEDIACRQIGFEGAGEGNNTYYPASVLSEGTHTYRLLCSGKEKTLQQCKREMVENCIELAGMKCRVRGGWSLWASWGDCSVTCENGTRTRTRHCNHPPPNFGGTRCPGDDLQYKPCSLPMCPIDGVWVTWSPWSECDVTCANGTRFRTRECTGPFYGGAECPGSDEDVEDCFPRMCPEDGVWNTWASWSECSHTCGYGSRNRSRSCRGPFYGGLECPGDPNDMETCNAFSCPVDGKWNLWIAWGECNVTCGGGSRIRTRECHNPLHGGSACQGESNQIETCNDQMCPIDGVWVTWSPWSECDVTCANGTRFRTRECTGPFYGGAECPGSDEDVEYCFPKMCPEDGVWNTWASWSECSHTCGYGSRNRSQTCRGPFYGGLECPGDPIDMETCNAFSCLVDGKWNLWIAWGKCNVTCGGGSRIRTRECHNPLHGGSACQGESNQIETCNDQMCPIDGVWVTWSPWSECDVTCANGTRFRTRECTGPFYGGAECPGSDEDVEDCFPRMCPEDGVWNTWASWSECSHTCGYGSRNRSRSCRGPFYRGLECPGDPNDMETCNAFSCPVDGKWDLWIAWGVCNVTCGGGSRIRTRDCHNPLHGGSTCQGESNQTETCNHQMCRKDGVFTDWTEWSMCSVTCAYGTQTRHRTCLGPYYGGVDCSGVYIETKACMIQECSMDGAWQIWQAWQSCNVTCGGGGKVRVRVCQGPYYGGRVCDGPSEDTAECNIHECPVDGFWKEWASWQNCNVTCGAGYQIRTRDCEQPQNGGAKCTGNNTENQTCNTHQCPVDGVFKEWSGWGACNVTCGGGVQWRKRSCDGPYHDGADCVGPYNNSQDCNNQECPIDGVWEEWASWQNCNVTCGGGYRIRTRDCEQPQNGGANCTGDDTQSQTCNTHQCPVDGVFKEWSVWGVCNVTCGGGVQWRKRFCDGPYYDGADCEGPYNNSQDCNTKECPIDGVWQSWTNWGQCTVTCDGGIRKRIRECEGPYHGGEFCEGLATDSMTCGRDDCPIDGVWQSWTNWGQCTVTCDGGIRVRVRECEGPYHGGADCEGLPTDSVTCGTDDCPSDWFEWSQWSLCTATCDGGTRHRNRTCGGGSYGSLTTYCEGLNEETRDCHTFDCLPLAAHCADWALRGLNQSGIVNVDPNPNDDVEQNKTVECDFDSEPGKAITILHHNKEKRIKVKGYASAGEFKLYLNYYVGWAEAIDIIDASEECAQYILWECLAAVIHIHYSNPITYWMNRNKQIAKYFGGATPGSENCACGETNSCVSEELRCNCDANNAIWNSDGGDITNKKDLPIHSFYAGDTDGPGETGIVFIGPVNCTGFGETFINSTK